MNEHVRYEIESGVPIPPIQRRGGGGRKSSYPFGDMEVDGSFLVPFDGDSPKTVARRVQVAKTQAAKRHPTHKYVIRTMPDGSGMRVWRVQ